MTKIAEIFDYLCELAPLELQMDFDNSGFQIGRPERIAKKVLLALDVTEEVADEAESIGAELIISHHPLIFRGVKTINGNYPEGELLLRLAEKGIAVISMHTNLDVADGGVNDVLIRLLGAEPTQALDRLGCGRIGKLETEQTLAEFLGVCKAQLKTNGLRYFDAARPVLKLAVMGGSGGDNFEDAYEKGCDTYVTADIKYHQFQRAAELGINLIDADHFCTENPVIFALKAKLDEKFIDVDFMVSTKHKAIISFA